MTAKAWCPRWLVPACSVYLLVHAVPFLIVQDAVHLPSLSEHLRSRSRPRSRSSLLPWPRGFLVFFLPFHVFWLSLGICASASWVQCVCTFSEALFSCQEFTSWLRRWRCTCDFHPSNYSPDLSPELGTVDLSHLSPEPPANNTSQPIHSPSLLISLPLLPVSVTEPPGAKDRKVGHTV